jgi:hypothetical protein
MNSAGKFYLGLVGAEDFPEQEPQAKYAKNHDLLWILIPFLGFLIFLAVVDMRHYVVTGSNG